MATKDVKSLQTILEERADKRLWKSINDAVGKFRQTWCTTNIMSGLTPLNGQEDPMVRGITVDGCLNRIANAIFEAEKGAYRKEEIEKFVQQVDMVRDVADRIDDE